MNDSSIVAHHGSNSGHSVDGISFKLARYVIDMGIFLF